jgi:hypothetical protein
LMARSLIEERYTWPVRTVLLGLRLEAHEIQQPEMAALVKPSQRPGTESCVVNR